ncbi:MAG: hypothetical protein Q8R57_04090 [Bacteroidota bacterium]|nr:hypothetical protein [Bacteroidota bacterium]
MLVAIVFIPANKVNAQVVYVTSNDNKFHSKNCSLIRSKTVDVTLFQAKNSGYIACKSCQFKKINAKSNQTQKSGGEIIRGSDIKLGPQKIKTDIGSERSSVIYYPANKAKK